MTLCGTRTNSQRPSEEEEADATLTSKTYISLSLSLSVSLCFLYRIHNTLSTQDADVGTYIRIDMQYVYI